MDLGRICHNRRRRVCVRLPGRRPPEGRQGRQGRCLERRDARRGKRPGLALPRHHRGAARLRTEPRLAPQVQRGQPRGVGDLRDARGGEAQRTRGDGRRVREGDPLRPLVPEERTVQLRPLPGASARKLPHARALRAVPQAPPHDEQDRRVGRGLSRVGLANGGRAGGQRHDRLVHRQGRALRRGQEGGGRRQARRRGAQEVVRRARKVA